MINLADYLRYLLMQRNCVVVPGFGLFYKERISALFLESGVILPPTVQIGFSPEKTENDGVLVDLIRKHQACSHQQASLEIAQSVEQWRTTLETGDSIKLSSWGILSCKADRWNIETGKNPIIDLSLFGLTPCTLPKYTTTVQPQLPAKPEEPLKVSLPKEKEEFYRFSISKRLVHQAMTAAAILLLWLSFSTPLENTTATHYAAIDLSPLFIPQLQFAGAIDEDTISSESYLSEDTIPSESIASEILESDSEFPAECTAVVTQRETAPSYAVIVGSLPTQAGAYQEIARLEKIGYSSLSLIEKEGRFRIASGTFSSQLEAEQALQKLKERQKECTDAWILSLL